MTSGVPRGGEPEDPIRAYDQEGREILIDRQEYRRTVLPVQFLDAGDDPDRLYDAIVLALQDGFFEEVVEPARRLYEIDHDVERATVVMGVALIKTGEFDEAEALFEGYLARHGASGVVLTNLAKIHAQAGKRELAEAVLWNALQAEPNQDNGLLWWGAIHYERGGEAGYFEALQRAAGIDGSWRPQLWLARAHLERDRLAEAMALYESVMPVAGEHGDALMMISGDLGNHGHPREALDLVGSRYDPQRHGALAGLNLIAACVQLGEIERGRRLCNDVERLGRFDVLEYLGHLRSQLRAA